LIITKQKTIDKILKDASTFRKIFVIGCGTCATACQTGGQEQVKAVSAALSDRLAGSTVVEACCDVRVAKRDLSKHKIELEGADAVLALSCGAGAQALGETTGKPVIAGLDTLFVGKIERIGRYYERCSACADCIISETGGICPVVRCAKGLLNGPCGGQVKGKCEASGYTRDCAWVLAYNSLKAQGRLEQFKKYRAPRDRSPKSQPQEIEAR